MEYAHVQNFVNVCRNSRHIGGQTCAEMAETAYYAGYDYEA